MKLLKMKILYTHINVKEFTSVQFVNLPPTKEV